MMRRCLKCFRTFSPRKNFYHTCPNCWTPAAEATAPAGLVHRVEQLERENGQLRKFASEKFIRSLLQLAHPDRHGDSALACEVTRTLLEMRGVLCETR